MRAFNERDWRIAGQLDTVGFTTEIPATADGMEGSRMNGETTTTGGRHGARCARQIRERAAARGESAWETARAIHQHCGVSLLRAHRYANGWTLIEVAERLRGILREAGQPAEGLAHQRVSHWESGLDMPTLRYLDALCRLYRTRPDRLGYGGDYTEAVRPPDGPTGHDTEDDEMDRRQLLGSLAVIAGSGVSAGTLLESLRIIRKSTIELLETQSVSSATVDDWEMVVQNYGLYRNRPPLLDLVTQMVLDFDELRRVLSLPKPLDHQRRLFHSMGELAGLIAINVNDSIDAPRETHAWFHVARLAAEEAEDRMLRAWVTAMEGVSYLWYDRPAERAIDLARTAQLLASPAPSVVSAIAASVEARGHATLGRRREALEAARRTEAIWERLPSEKTATVTQLGFCEQNMRFHQEMTYTLVGETAAAKAEQDRVLTLPAYDRTHSTVIKIDQAYCLVRSGEVDEACRLAGEALSGLPPRSRGGIALFRARKLAAMSGAVGQRLPAVRDLRELVHEVSGQAAGAAFNGSPSSAVSRLAASRASSVSPSAALAPDGSPRTPLGLTARTPRSVSCGMISASGLVSPAAAASRRTSAGASASMTEVSNRPAWASETGEPGSPACHT